MALQLIPILGIVSMVLIVLVVCASDYRKDGGITLVTFEILLLIVNVCIVVIATDAGLWKLK